MHTKMVINGELIESSDSFAVENPATGEIIAEAPQCNQEILERAVTSASDAFTGWARRKDRAECLLECAKRLKSQTVRLAKLLTQEQGKPLRESMNEIMGASLTLRHVAAMKTPSERELRNGETEAGMELIRSPRGVVAAITPWNYPIMLAIWKLAPALRAGNTVVLKPSPYTPLTTLELGELFRDILPPGVLTIVAGGNRLGAELTGHAAIQMITLTGSVATGIAVAQAAATDLKHVVLELGGNDAAIVLPDAVPEQIAESLFWGAFRNCGQVCLAIKRLYVHDAIFSRVVDELKRIAEGTVMGDGLDKRTTIGPLNNLPQLDHVEALVEHARKAGARIVTGGNRRAGSGYFFEPTIVDDVQEGFALVDEEQFGPALPLVRYHDVDDAIERANTTQFGLGGSVWSSDPKRAEGIARHLECGTVWVNQHGATHAAAPVGGQKWSGMGYENGAAGLNEFYRLQTVFAAPKTQ